jgi:cation diffusion facilitator CzcD-associated flavoprotein CzcO
LVLAHLDWLLQSMSHSLLQRPSECIFCILFALAEPFHISSCRRVFEKIAIFERQAKVGGLQNHTPETHDPLFKVPLTNPNVPLEQPVYHINGDQREPVIITPVYDGLETNIPHPLMQFSDQDFPKGILLFPKHDVILAYLEKYAKNVWHLIHFSTQVVDIALQISSQGNGTW